MAMRWRRWTNSGPCRNCHCLILTALLVSIYALVFTGSFTSSFTEWSDDPKLHSGASFSGDLRTMKGAWNQLCFGDVAKTKLRIALFVKKWPVDGIPGGLERHALTLHTQLVGRGHIVHVYTMSADAGIPEHVKEGGLHVHFLRPTQGGSFDYNHAWQIFQMENSSLPFDVVHSESVALPHWKAREVEKLAASWHGINYEIIHSEIIQDLIRKPGETRSPDLYKALTERVIRVAEEVRFFPSYRHHVAISDYVSDVLKTIYEIPNENVHTILNGVDNTRFRPDPLKGKAFRLKHGIPLNASLVLGTAGRLVRDKGHPLLFEAFSEIIKRHKNVYLLVAGHGPWKVRYEELAPYVKTLGPMIPMRLVEFYNALDIFVNPTLRSQGLDLTLLEAMQCGKTLLATRFPSITQSIIIHDDFGYTFSPNVNSLVSALESSIKDGKTMMQKKGQVCLQYAQQVFTATKMASSYERLFLCMNNERYCQYPLAGDCMVQPRK